MIALFAVLAVCRPYIWTRWRCSSPTSSWVPSPSRSGAGWHPYQQNRLLTFLNPEVDPPEGGLPRHPVEGGDRLGRVVRHRVHPGPPEATGLPAGAAHRLHLLGGGRGAGLPRRHGGAEPVRGALSVLVRIARRATDPFSSLCVFGILGLLFTHVFENVGMTVNLMPITGIPLPFFSYGGSFFLICCACIGIALRVAAESDRSAYHEF